MFNMKEHIGKSSPILSKDELIIDAIPNRYVFRDNRYFSSVRAVKEVERRLGCELEPRFKHLVKEEGFFAGRYFDDRVKDPVETSGVGQTGKYITMPLLQVFEEQESSLARIIPSYNNQPEEVKAALLSAKYRGDLKSTYNWVKQFNKGNYQDAAVELLDHKEYLTRKKKNPNDGVVKRLDNISKVIANINN